MSYIKNLVSGENVDGQNVDNFGNIGQNVDGQNVDGKKKNPLYNLLFNKNILLSLVLHNWLSVTNKLTATFGIFHLCFSFIQQIVSMPSVYQSMSPYLVSYFHLCSSFIHHIYYINLSVPIYVN